MQLLENFDPVLPFHNRKKIEDFIDQSLLGDWIIRVEYSGRDARGQSDWLQWDSTFFAITSPDDVMKAIDSCYAYFPEREIRIYAEKVQPEMRMAYSVYRPAKEDLNNKVCVNADIVSEAANQEWPQAINAQSPNVSVAKSANSKWSFLAVAGVAGTLLLWEAASS